MLFYGDAEQQVAPAAILSELRRDDGRHLSHDALRDRFVILSGLAQGVADSDYRTCGADRSRAAEDQLLDALMAIGSVLLRSWDRDFAGGNAPPLPELAGMPEQVIVREAEGYAHYALYPEAYGLAARQLRLDASPFVIGLRSIGSGLAAMAAAALGAPRPVTLRPCGDAFNRSLAIDDELQRRMLESERHFVIVDEGPGLSGSSFGCVADWLEERGVPRNRIAFLPGHAGDLGPEASPAHRERWAATQRPVVQPDRLRTWVQDVVGDIDDWKDLSGGAWRPLWSASEDAWPAVVPAWERTKFLVKAGETAWMVRFAGLGSAGAVKLKLARRLEESGFGPEVAGLTHGWLVQRWHYDAQPTRPTADEVMRYLVLRGSLPAQRGASLVELLAMVRRNVPELARWNPPVEQLQALSTPVAIDGRMQAHEWLRLPDGRLLKADALDHHRGHDLVGPQDITWDRVGAEVELGIAFPDSKPGLTNFLRVAYCAFQVGAHSLGQSMSPASEAPRHEAAIRRYRSALVDAVEQLRHVDQPLGFGVEALA